MNVNDIVLAVRQAVGGISGGSQLLFVGLLVLVAVFFVVVVVLLIYSRSPQGQLEGLFEERAEGSSTSKWPTRLAVLGIMAAALLTAEFYAGAPDQCATCHQADYAETLQASDHAGISCMSCHRPPGVVTGRLSQAAAYTRWILVYTSTKKSPEPRTGSVDSDSCLRCHREVTTGTLTSGGIRVRHSDFLQEGGRCRECHNSSAHTVKEPSEPRMDKCVVCHDGDRASNECDTCHVKDLLQARAEEIASLPKVKTVDTGDCYSCHEERPCLSCHGVTMPHPDGWAPGQVEPGYPGSHARAGFVDREVCWRCHHEKGKVFEPADEGCSCHGLLGKMHGGEAWVKEHGLQATGRKTGVYADCFTCHSHRLCEHCHPASYNDRYSPQPGPDEYRRDIPHDPFYFDY